MTLNAAPPSSSNWPHPLDAVFDNGKRRRKQYFPEGLHGMYMLSKTEISDDIDLIEADADRTAFGHARRRACRVNSSKDEMDVDQEFGEAGSTAGTLAANKATKRQRLLDRFLDEHGIRDDARIELTKVRRALDDTRDQIQSFRDGIARLERQLAQCKVEEAALKAMFEERQAEQRKTAAALEEARQQFEAKVAASDSDLADAAAQVQVLERFEKAALAKDAKIRGLELDIEALKRELAVNQEGRGLRSSAADESDDVIEVEEASGSVGGAHHKPPTPSGVEAFIHQYTKELHDLTGRLKASSNRILELEHEKSDQEGQLRLAREQLTAVEEAAKDATAKSASQAAEIESLQEAVSRSAAEQESVKKMVESLTYDIEMGAEKMSSYMMVVEAAEQRALRAEERLHEVFRKAAVFKSGNIQLQNKLDRLVTDHAELKAAKDALVAELAALRGSALASPAAGQEGTTAHDDADYALKRSLQNDLRNVQLDMERLSDERDLDAMEDDEQGAATATPLADDEVSNAATDGGVMSLDASAAGNAGHGKPHRNGRDAASRRRSSRAT
ncbi:Uncharacterized protein PBTT_08420 [Plasmodiophora brassicae]